MRSSQRMMGRQQVRIFFIWTAISIHISLLQECPLKTKSDSVNRQKIREDYYVFLSSPDLIGFRHSLFLNIVIPPSFDPSSFSSKFPVKVYIHGGYDRNSCPFDFNLKMLCMRQFPPIRFSLWSQCSSTIRCCSSEWNLCNYWLSSFCIWLPCLW